jgi:hypothetical protein
MKKVLISLFMAVAIILPVNSAEYSAANRVQEVGQNLLTKNGITTANVKFMVVSGVADNSNYQTDKVVNVSSAELAYAGNDNEVAAVVANELGHIICGHSTRSKFAELLQAQVGATVNTNETVSALASNYKATKEDKEADIMATELMVNAGYSPLATIVVYTKQTGTYWETLQGKPANAERAMNVYNYVSYAFPAKVKAGYGCNEYRNFLIYADRVVADRKANKKQEDKNTKAQAKAKKNSTNTISKFKTRGGMSGWDAAFNLLNAQ